MDGKPLLLFLLLIGLLYGASAQTQLANTQRQSLQQAIEAKQWDHLPEYNDPLAAETLVAHFGEPLGVSSYEMACLGSVLVDPLLARLHDPDPLIRKQILEVLTNIYCRDENGMDASDPRLINTLVSGMADADAGVREKAFYNACTLISNCEISQEAFARLEQAVVEAISSPDTHIRKAATRAAYVFRAPAVRNALVTLLQSPDAQTRQWAIQHLGYSHEPPAVTDALVDALHDPEIHIEVTLALARLGDSRAIEPLCRLLQDEAYCYEAVVMLHRLKVPQAIPALLSLITSRSVPAQDREHAAIVLGEMGLPALNPLLHAWKRAASHAKPYLALALAFIQDSRTIPLLRRYLYQAKTEDRQRILGALSYRQDADTAALLKTLAEGHSRAVAVEAIDNMSSPPPLSLLKHRDPRRREAVLYNFATTYGPLEPVLTCLRDPDVHVRAAAVYALRERIPDSSIAEALVPLLYDQEVCFEAALMLARQGDARGAEVLIAALRSPEKREDALRAFQQIQVSAAVPMLITLLKDEDNNICIAAMRALGAQREPTATAALLQMLESGQRDELVWVLIGALSNTGDPLVVQPLVAFMEQYDYENAFYVNIDPAVKALGKLGDPRAIPAILQAMESPRNVREEAVPALVAMGDAAYDPAVKLIADPRPWMREAGVTILARLGKREAAPLLEAALSDPDPEVRAAIVDALDTLHSANAAVLVPPLLSDSAAVVRQAAARVLGKMGEKAHTPALRRLLTDPSMSVRYTAAGALANFGDEQGLTLLLDAAENGTLPNRKIAITVLGEVNDPHAFDILIRILNDRTDRHAHEAVANALVQRGDTRAIGPLMELFQQDYDYLGAIESALRKLTGLSTDWQLREWWLKQQQTK